jgi:hypothetical protein
MNKKIVPSFFLLYFYSGQYNIVGEYAPRVHRVVKAAFWRTFRHEGKISLAGKGGRAPPTLTSQANFTLMMECTPESGRYHSVYSVGRPHILYQRPYIYID